MKKSFSLTLLVFLLFYSSITNAQEIERRVSQYASVTQRIGITDVSVEYHRPKVKGRDVWGKLVPYGYNYLGYGSSKAAPWRAGANESTKITFSEDVIIEGNRLNAGTYGLFMAVFENGEVDVIFSNNASLWGSYDYKSSEDALRVKIKSAKSSFTELLTYEFIEVEPKTATLRLRWEKKSFSIKIIATR